LPTRSLRSATMRPAQRGAEETAHPISVGDDAARAAGR
jgi:hypothetical protein